MRETGLTPGFFVRLLVSDGEPLISSGGRTNILLLGIGGGDHDGPDLTDTIMVLSLDSLHKTAALISIPRDIWSDSLKDKVNSAYHYGEQKKKGGGITLARAVTEDMIGMPVHYGLLIDFAGFKNVIDLIGGIDVNVSQAFTDTQYPIPGKEHDTCPGDPTNACVYETVHFDAGLQHMNGDRSLIYVRSRHADGAEGSDFARSRRQQEVVIALKNRLMHPTQWMTLARLKALPKVLDDATDTDMNMGELMTVGKLFLKIPQNSMKKIAFDTLLTQPPEYLYGGRFVLVPTDDWQTVQSFIAQQLR